MLAAILGTELTQLGGERSNLVVEAQAVASRLTELSPGRHVVLSCRRAESFVPGLLGAWWAGAMVELLPNVQPGTLDRVDGDARVAHVLHDDLERQERSPKALYVPSALAAGAGSSSSPAAWPALAVRMSTSGTTAQPRYVDKTPEQLLRELDVLARVVAPARCTMSTVPLSHLYGLLFGCLVPLRHGARVVSHEALLPAEVARVIEREGVDLLLSTPAHLRAMLEARMPRGLRVISSGAHLPPELFLGLGATHQWQVTEVLGSTETGGIATRTDPMSSWTPLPEVTVRAEDERLVVQSPWCGDAPIALEDAVRVHPDGSFVHLGRRGDLIKIAGKRAQAQALEAAVLAVPGVRDAAVLVHAPAGREPRVALAVCSADGAAVSREAIASALRAGFDAVFVPKIVRELPEIPRTERGKVNTAALRALLELESAPVRTVPLERRDDGDYDAEIPHDLVFFLGHFESFTLLPGAVLLERVVWPVVKARYPELRMLRGLRRLRFRRPVLPGQRLTVRCSRESGRVSFDVTCAQAPVASGFLLVE